jgi:hypothetical protein
MEKDLFDDEDGSKNKSVEENIDVFSYEEETVETVEDNVQDNKEWFGLDEKDLELTLPPDMNANASSADHEAAGKDATPASREEEKGIDEHFDIFDGAKDEKLGTPPWEENAESTEISFAGTAKKTKIFLWIGLLIFIAFLFAGLYVFLQYKQIAVDQVNPPDDKKIFSETYSDQEAQNKTPMTIHVPEEEPGTQTTPTPANAAPVITGEPKTIITEGTPYEFTPSASDADAEDELTFFIANQPPWLNFDVTNGALRGTPGSESVGAYKDIVILVSDGRAIASLPRFDITVTKAAPKTTAPPKTIVGEVPVAPKTDSGNVAAREKETPSQVLVKKEDISKVQTEAYVLPDMKHLILDSKFQDAASEYHRSAKKVPKAFSIKLEVDCRANSVLLAFQNANFDPRMFILSKKMGGKDCFVVFWGLYATNSEAIKALSTIPDFFQQQASKPQLVIVKPYL